MRNISVLTGLVLASALLGGAALAQGAAPAAPAQPAAAAAPEVKVIGDWAVRCFPAASVSPCDMYQEQDDKNTRQRVVSTSIAAVPSRDNYAMQIAVPLGIAIPAGVVIQTDSYTSPVLHYRRCDRAGCYVEMIVPNDMIASLSHSGADARIKIVADTNKTFGLRLSLNGFAAANDAMVASAKQKAKSPSPGELPPAQPGQTP